MDKIRIGNDIGIRWAIYAGEGVEVSPYDLTGRNLSLYLINMFGKKRVESFSVEGHILSFTYRGKDQNQTGVYQLTLVENEGLNGMHTVDECDAFELVRCSCLEGKESEGRIETVRMEFRSVMTMAGAGGGPVDTELDPSSPNAISNAAVSAAVAELKQSIKDSSEGLMDEIEDAIALSIPHDFNSDFNSDFAI